MTSTKSNPYRSCSGRPKPQTCPYCQHLAVLKTDSCGVYGGRDYGPMYICEPCQAWVGCHPGTQIALGRLADKELRRAKSAVHAVFDPLWKIKQFRTHERDCRTKAYRWLARQMKIAPKDCHVGQFDLDQCALAVAICTPILEKIRENERQERAA